MQQSSVSHVGSIRGEDVDATLEQMIQQIVLPSVSCALVNWARLRNNSQHFEGTINLKSPVELWDVTPSLYSAIITPMTELVDQLINNGNCNITLHVASDRGSLALAQLLLEKGRDVNATGGEYGTALQAASWRGRVEIVKILLANGADVDIIGGKYGTALHAASFKSKAVKLLLEQGPDVTTAQEEAGLKSDARAKAVVQLLQEHGALETGTPIRGRSPSTSYSLSQ